jgi:hypothetical protein
MSREADAKNLRLYDRRTIERNIKKGLISRKDYDKFLKSLDDVKDKGIQGEEPAAEAPAAPAQSAPAAPQPSAAPAAPPAFSTFGGTNNAGPNSH